MAVTRCSRCDQVGATHATPDLCIAYLKKARDNALESNDLILEGYRVFMKRMHDSLGINMGFLEHVTNLMAKLGRKFEDVAPPDVFKMLSEPMLEAIRGAQVLRYLNAEVVGADEVQAEARKTLLDSDAATERDIEELLATLVKQFEKNRKNFPPMSNGLHPTRLHHK